MLPPPGTERQLETALGEGEESESVGRGGNLATVPVEFEDLCRGEGRGEVRGLVEGGQLLPVAKRVGGIGDRHYVASAPRDDVARGDLWKRNSNLLVDNRCGNIMHYIYAVGIATCVHVHMQIYFSPLFRTPLHHFSELL